VRVARHEARYLASGGRIYVDNQSRRGWLLRPLAVFALVALVGVAALAAVLWQGW
jgi:hypothetical protein